MTTLTGKLIRIDQIDIPPEWERKSSLVEDDALRKSIEATGVQQPVSVFEKSNGRYGLIKGGRRIAICQFLDVKTIPAVVDELPKDVEPSAYQNRLRFILDEHRQDLFPSQRAMLIKQMMDRFDMTQKEVAAYLGVDPGSITNWMAVDRYAPEIVKAIDTGEINLHAARSFDGMKPEAQVRVFKANKREFTSLAGGKLHKLIRQKYSPKAHPDLYVAPEKTVEKLARKAKGRSSRRRPKLTHSEKEMLARDLSLKEIELKDGKDELQMLNREVTLATPIIRAIMRDGELMLMLPPEMGPELERFAEVYC